jgi:putative transposase
MANDTTITPELLDRLLANYTKPEDLLGEDGLLKQLKKALVERALGAELSEHLGYEKGDPAGRGSGNNRNGFSAKTVLTDDGEIEISVPRDRAGTFEPELIPKGQTRFDGFDDKILRLYAGLKGFPEAITTPTIVPTCIVHRIRNSLAFVSWKDRRAIMPSLKAIDPAEAAGIARSRLEEFEAEWGKRCPAIGQLWRRAWEHVVPFFAFAPGIGKMIYTANCVAAPNRLAHAKSSRPAAVFQMTKRL